MAKKTPSVPLSDVQDIAAGANSSNLVGKAALLPADKVDALTPAAASKAALLAARAKKKLTQEEQEAQESLDARQKAEEIAEQPQGFSDVILAQATPSAPAAPSAGGSVAAPVVAAAPASSVSVTTMALAGLGLAAVAGGGGGSSSAPPAPVTNVAPVASNKAQAVTEGHVVTGSVTATDANVGDKLTYSLVGGPVAGLTFNADGTYTFDPTSVQHASLAAGDKLTLPTIRYSVSDGSLSATGELVITITGTAEDFNGDRGRVLTLSEPSVSKTAADVTTVIEPVISKETYWGDPVTGKGVPIDKLATALQTFLGDRLDVLDMFSVQEALNQIARITLNGDQSADDIVLGDYGNDSPVNIDLGQGDYNVGSDSSVNVDIGEGSYTGNYEITVTLTDGTLASTTIALNDTELAFVKGLLYTSTGASRLFEVETKTWPQVNLLDSNGDPVRDADNNIITYSLHEYTAKGKTTVTHPSVVLTTKVNNGSTVEPGLPLPNDGDDIIVAGSLDLLDDAYIDAGAGNNTLEIEADGGTARPLALLNLQTININNSTAEDYVVIDLGSARDVSHVTITEDYESYDDLTVMGIRNGATLRLEGAFYNNVTVAYGEGINGPLTVEIDTGEVYGNLYLAHNSSDLNLVSLGKANVFYGSDLDATYGDLGTLTNLNISGPGSLTFIDDLNNSFLPGTGVTIDASENTGGVNLKLALGEDLSTIHFLGSTGNDTVQLSATGEGGEVTVDGGAGDNRYILEASHAVTLNNANGDGDTLVSVTGNGYTDVSLTLGDGNNEYYVEQVKNLRVAAGDGANEMELYSTNLGLRLGNGANTVSFEGQSANGIVAITAGNGGNRIDLTGGNNPASATINTGSGNDTITVDSKKVTINAGEGSNTITADGGTVVVTTTGSGSNKITSEADSITITTGTGKDTITVLGDTVVVNSGGGGDTINIEKGQDSDYVYQGSVLQLTLGTGDSTVNLGTSCSVTAMQGSFITGSNVKLYVDTVADLRAATLTGVKSVVLNNDGDNVELTLTSAQFQALGASAFSVEGSIFHTHAFLHLIVNSSTSLTALGVDDLPSNIDLRLEVADGVTLTMTAQQLHERVAANGVTITDDNNSDRPSGKIVITGAGLAFDAWNTDDVNPDQNIKGDADYVGGSLSSDFSTQNVDIHRVLNSGYNRPVDTPNLDVVTLDTTGANPVVQAGFTTISPNFEIKGTKGVTFTSDVDLGNNFKVDFSQAAGVVSNLTLLNFQEVKQIRGNDLDTTVYIKLSGEDPTVGDSDAGLNTAGVSRYLVTNIADTTNPEGATIYLGDSAQDVRSIGLRGNYSATLNLRDVASGIAIELQGDGKDYQAGDPVPLANGPAGTSNIGTVNVTFAEDTPAAVVNINNQGKRLTARGLDVDGLVVTNVETVTVNVRDGDANIDSINGDEIASLVFSSSDDISVEGIDMYSLHSVDAHLVTGTFTAYIDQHGDFSFVGSRGGSELTFGEDFSRYSKVSIDGGVGGVALILGEDADFRNATLSNIDSIKATEDLTLTHAQMDMIGQANLSTDGYSNLVVVNFGADPTDAFNGALLTAAGFNIQNLTMASGANTLAAGINLSGVDDIFVGAGGTLTLSVKQFMEMANDRIDCDKGVTIHLTGLTQAQVDAGFSLASINGSGVTVTVALAESVELASGTDLGDDDPTFIIGAFTLGVATQAQANGLNVTGSGTLEMLFNSNSPMDASDYDVGALKVQNVMVDDSSVEDLFPGLSGSVEVLVYNVASGLIELHREVTVSAGTPIPGGYQLNDSSADSEVVSLTLSLQGGASINGDVNLATSDKDPGFNGEPDDVTVIQGYLKTVAISSTGDSANTITGALTPAATYPGVTNNLLDVSITGTQALTIGGIVFNSVTKGDFDDGVLTNDNKAAVANLSVNDAKTVSVGVVNTQDDDVDGLNVVNSGAGALKLTIDSDSIDSTDALSFTGGKIELTLQGIVDLANDVTSGVDKITLADNSTTTLTHAQFVAVAGADISTDGTPVNVTLHLTKFGANDGDVFDASALASGITVSSITMAKGAHTLAAGINLKDVGQIILAKGDELTLTAAQFQQLSGTGTIAAHGATIHITGLTQAQVDAGFNLSGIDGEHAVTLTLAEDVSMLSGTNLGELDTLEVILAAGQELSVKTLSQATGLNVTGGDDSTVTFLFPFTDEDTIDCSGYDVTTVRVLNVSIDDVGHLTTFLNLPSGVNVSVYDDFSGLDLIDYVSSVEPGVTVPGSLIFDDSSDDSVVRSLTLNLEGGARVEGDIHLTTSDKDPGYNGEDGQDVSVIQRYLESVVINSTGTAHNTLNDDTANVIAGALMPMSDEEGEVSNNLLSVVVNASQELIIEGGIHFNSVVSDDFADGVTANDRVNAMALLVVNGTSDVNVGELNTQDDDVDSLLVVNSGSGTVSLTLDSDSIDATDVLSFISSGEGGIEIDAEGTIDLQNDNTTGVTAITVDGVLILTHAQFLGIEQKDVSGDTLHLTEFDASIAFDGTKSQIDVASISFASVYTAASDDGGALEPITLNPDTDLSGVGVLHVPYGAVLNMTAAQFQQLVNNGSIEGSNYTLNITDLTQADVGGDLNGDGDTADTGEGVFLNLGNVVGAAHITLTLAEDVNFQESTYLADTSILEVIMSAGQTLGFANIGQVGPVADTGSDGDFAETGSGITVTGGSNTTVDFLFGTPLDATDTVDLSGIHVTTLRLLNTFVANRDVELLQNLDESVTVDIYENFADPEYVTAIDRKVIIEENVTVPGDLVFNDFQDDSEVVTLELTLKGGVTLDGDLILTTVDKDPALEPARNFETLTINSEGNSVNTITGDIYSLVSEDAPQVIGGNTEISNNLLEVIVNADQALVVEGDIVFNNIGTDGDEEATLTLNGSDDVTVHSLVLDNGEDRGIDPSSDGISGLTINNNLAGGTLTVTGGPGTLGVVLIPDVLAVLPGAPAIYDMGGEDGSVEFIDITGAGDTVLGSAPGATGIEIRSLSSIDASGSTGLLNLGQVVDVNSQNFSFTSGSGKTLMTMGEDYLYTPGDNDTGWSFDFTNAGSDSEFHLGGTGDNLSYASDEDTTVDLSITLGDETTLYIDEDTNLSNVDVLISQGAKDIVLKDGVTLTLTAAQADGLHIVAGKDTGAAGITAKVYIVDLGEAEVDLSGIAANIAQTVTLAGDSDADVTLDEGTDLGHFAVNLFASADGVETLNGQTIRFQNIAQAERDIFVGSDDSTDEGEGGSSTNVVWLFDELGDHGPVDTSGYESEIGRLWVSDDLVASVGGDVEDLFTTLPEAIVRVDFADLTDLEPVYPAVAVDRVIELVHFTELPGGLTIDDGFHTSHANDEFVRNATINMGGEVTVGDITIGDVLASDTDPESVYFDTLTINSELALRTGDLLAADGFVNDNDGTAEVINGVVEKVQPQAFNTVGDISIIDGSGMNLLDVVLNTFSDSVYGEDGNGYSGADLNVGTITFEVDGDLTPEPLPLASVPKRDLLETAYLTVTGENDVRIASLNTNDADIDTLDIDLSDFDGVLTVHGGSPALAVDNTETVRISNVADRDYVISMSGNFPSSSTLTYHFVVDGAEHDVSVNYGSYTGGFYQFPDATKNAIQSTLDGIAPGVFDVEVPVGTNDVVVSLKVPGSVNFDFVGTGVSAGDVGASFSVTGPNSSVVLGSSGADEGVAHAGVSGNTLSLLDADDYIGDLDLGVISMVDSDDDGEDAAFTFDSGTGLTTMTMGAIEGEDGYEAPTLAAGSTWVFDFSDAADGSAVTFTDAVTFEDGSTLSFKNAQVNVQGNIDWTDIHLEFSDDGAADNDGHTIRILEGSVLTLTIGQMAALAEADIDITGSGTLKLIGDATINTSMIVSDSMYEVTDLLQSLDFSDDSNVSDWYAGVLHHVKSVGVDLSELTISASDDNIAIEAYFGSAVDDDGAMWLGRDFTGSANNDILITDLYTSDASADLSADIGTTVFPAMDLTTWFSDTLDGGAGNDALVGGLGSDTFIVNSGTDLIFGLKGLPMDGSADAVLDASADLPFVIGSANDFSGDNLVVSAAGETLETFTLTLDGLVVAGASDADNTVSFQGLDVLLGSDDTLADMESAFVAAASDDEDFGWTISTGADATDGILEFTAKTVGHRDPDIGDFVFGSDSSSMGDSTVDLTQAGATAYAYVLGLGSMINGDVSDSAGMFVADEETINNGVAVLMGGSDDDTLIDVSMAEGTQGFTLIGGSSLDADLYDSSALNSSSDSQWDAILGGVSDSGFGSGDNFDSMAPEVGVAENLGHAFGGSSDDGMDFLIGSKNDDIINGGNDMQVDSDAIDVLTGNGGSDQFVFNVDISEPVAFTVSSSDDITPTYLTVTADGSEFGDEFLTFSYTLGGVPGDLTVTYSDAVFDSESQLGNQIAALFDAVTGISASYCDSNLADELPGVITIYGDGGTAFEYIPDLGLPRGNVQYGGTTNTLSGLFSDGDTQYATQIATLGIITSDSNEHVGETYGLDITIDGSTYTVSHVVAAGDTTATILASLLSDFSDDVTGAFGTDWTGSVVGNTLIITDLGGSSDSDLEVAMTASTAGHLTGTGASEMNDNGVDGIAGTSDDGGIDLITADIITDFEVGVDSIVFRTHVQSSMEDGSDDNFMVADTVASSYEDALEAANLAFSNSDDDIQYYLTDADGTFLAPFDANFWLAEKSGLEFDSEFPAMAEVGSLLFFDANLDGVADGVIHLLGNDANGGIDIHAFQATDIVTQVADFTLTDYFAEYLRHSSAPIPA